MTKTINGLTVTTSAASSDLLPIWRAANNDTRAITKANFMGGVLTGGGTIATGGFTLTVAAASTINGSLVGNMTGGGTVATGGNTLTVSGTSTINGSLVGSMTGSGTVATGGNTLTVGGTSTINGSLVGSMTGSGTVATGGFTLTVPATGTASLLATAQTYSALKTFSAGLTFGEDTLANYDEGTWTFAVVGASGSPSGRTYAQQAGRYTRIGNIVFVGGWITINALGTGDSGDARFSLPITSASGLANSGAMLVQWNGVNIPGTAVTVVAATVSGSAYFNIIGQQDNAVNGGITQMSDLANSDTVVVTGFYFV